ncbi:MAG TPA: magnesium transporter CorA family protein [Chitinophagales bacterium]|jgi:magnesium transporter|nr:magnesium transporter CorA family protein [Chitinophagales bacterium]MBP6155160.1 magnesium transporter CorA family protein [Chitinophagales bacterium]HQV77391.1 magnesium transporter CorA family protein [Chitinophagales bacterium]HQW78453.1 magnesium transporter CorA family protein [Chitinophagales bacterium]HRB67528.1 magnesium transporter CorA family protein [Chitinophagales bacterium]
MITIYKKIEDTLQSIQQVEKDCWINIAPPFSMAQLEQFAKEQSIPFSYIVDCIDQYERSRYEQQEDAKLIVINTPILNEGFDLEDEATYITIPVGIILIPDIIITVCSVNNPLIEWFERNFQKNINLQNRNDFVIRIFERNIYYFLHYLREINKRISQIEKELNYSSRNQELNKLLHLQKALIYFVNDLRADEMVLLKIQRNDFLELKDDERIKDKFQDILIDNSQALEMANVYSNILGNMMGAFASIISNNLGHVVNRLTAVTIALMLPTLIAGIYGMNIDLPFQHHAHAFTIVVSISILCSLVFVFYFRKKRWL